MKKHSFTVQEILPKPYDKEVPPFEQYLGIREASVPLFGNYAIEIVNEYMKLAHDLLLAEPLTVFWGISGLLGCYYSEITGLTAEEANLKVTVLKPAQSFQLVRESGLKLIIERLGGMETLQSIPFEEALLILEGKKQPPSRKYEEPEEDEVGFDENCLPECRPGEHVCGKS